MLRSDNDYLKRLGDALNPCPLYSGKDLKEIVENPPALAIKGGCDSRGVHEELDELTENCHWRKRIPGGIATKRN